MNKRKENEHLEKYREKFALGFIASCLFSSSEFAVASNNSHVYKEVVQKQISEEQEKEIALNRVPVTIDEKTGNVIKIEKDN